MGISMLGFEFNAEMVGWIVTGVVGLFAVFGMFWGLIRGLQKTAFRGLWLILVAGILLLLTPVITKWLLTIDLSGFGWTISGQPVTSVEGLLQTFLNEIPEISDATANNPILLEFVSKLPLLLLNSLIFVILFWLFKIILWPIWAIFAKSFFKKYKTVDGVRPKEMPKQERVKVKNFKGLGMLLGILCGLFVGAVTVMPVMGILNVVEKLNGANTSFITAEESDEGIIDYYAGDYSDMLSGATNNVGTQILDYTGLSWVSNQMFDELSTIKVGNDSISLNDEVDGVVGVLNAVGEIRCTDFDNLTQESVSNVITNARKVVKYLFELKTFTVVGDELVPYLADMVSSENLIETGVEQGDNVIDDALLELAQTDMEYLQGELNAFIDIAQVINDYDLLVPAIYQNVPFDEYLERCDSDFVNDFVDALFSSRIFSAISVSAINEGLDYVMEEFDMGDYEENTALDTTVLKQQFKNIMNNGITLAKHMDIGDTFSMDKEALPPIGGLLDNFKALMTTNTFNTLIDKLKSTVSDSIGTEEFYADNILNAIDNLKTITNYEAEFEIYEGVWDDIMELKDADFSDFSTFDTSKVGAVLDGLRDSLVFGPIIDDTVVDLLDQVKTSITSDMTDVDLKDSINDAFDAMIWNINDENLVRSDTFWTNELAAFASLFDVDMDSIGSSGTTSLSEVGAALDSARASVLLTRSVNEAGNALNGKNAFTILIDAMFDMATDSMDSSNTLIVDSLAEIKENLLELPTAVTYASEFGYLSDFMDGIEDFDDSSLDPSSSGFEDTLAEFGEMLDGLAESNLFVSENNESCPDVRQKFVTYMLDQVQDSMTLQVIIDLLDDMKGNVKYIESYEDEFGYLASLTGMVDDFNGGASISTLSGTMTNLGTKLDNLGGSKLFVHEADPAELTDVTIDLRRDILTYMIEQIEGQLSSSLGTGIDASALIGSTNSLMAEMKGNVDNMPLPSDVELGSASETPYADEMTHLLTVISSLTDISNYGNLFSNSESLLSFGAKLDHLKQGYVDGTKIYRPSILCQNTGYYVLKMFVNATDISSVLASVGTDISAQLLANVEKVNATNYSESGAVYSGTVATGTNYTEAMVSLMQISSMMSQLTTIGSTLDGNTLDSLAYILADLQEKTMADYNVVKVIGIEILNQLITTKGLTSGDWYDAIQREIGYINTATEDYVLGSTGNGYRVSFFFALNDTDNDNQVTVSMVTVPRATFVSNYQSSSYTLSFSSSGEAYVGELPASSYRAGGVSMVLPGYNMACKGYTFAGWSDGTTTYSTGSSYTMPAVSTILYAAWTPTEYAITYSLDSGTNSGSNPSSYTIETATITLNDATKTGYTFDGWYTTSDFQEGTKVTEIPTGSTGDLTLYAKWTANS